MSVISFSRKAFRCSLFVAIGTIASLYGSFANAQERIKKIDGSRISSETLEKHIQMLMVSGKVAGLQLAVLNDNKVVYRKAFGYKNSQTKEPYTTNTNVYGASFSKAVFAVLVMKLVEEGKLDLDKPLQEYLPMPIYDYAPQKKWQDNYADFKSDTLYKNITARMCLAHTTGLPNWRWDNPDQKLRIAFKPGSCYSYSGEGMVYLQTVIEKMLDQPLEQLVQEKVFDPAGMKNSAYTFLPRFEVDFAYGHRRDGSLYEKDKDNEPRAASTLETTLYDYALFLQALMSGKLLARASEEEMFKPQIRLKSVEQMGPLSKTETDAFNSISLSYGLGWGLLKSPYGWGAFKEGHGDGFQHYSIIFPAKRIGIAIMTNSDNGESIFKELLEVTIGDTYTPWQWQKYIPYNLADK